MCSPERGNPDNNRHRREEFLSLSRTALLGKVDWDWARDASEEQVAEDSRLCHAYRIMASDAEAVWSEIAFRSASSQAREDRKQKLSSCQEAPKRRPREQQHGMPGTPKQQQQQRPPEPTTLWSSEPEQGRPPQKACPLGRRSTMQPWETLVTQHRNGGRRPHWPQQWNGQPGQRRRRPGAGPPLGLRPGLGPGPGPPSPGALRRPRGRRPRLQACLSHSGGTGGGSRLPPTATTSVAHIARSRSSLWAGRLGRHWPTSRRLRLAPSP